MSDVTQSELLINALLDGQLDTAEAERVSKQIANDEQLSKMLAAFTRQRAAIADLPQYKLKDRFADRVLEIAAAEAAARPMLNRPPPSSVDWKKYAMSLAAIAGLLMGMLVYQWTPLSKQDGPTVAVLSSSAKPDSTKDNVASLPKMDRLTEGNEQSSSTEPSSETVLAEASPPLAQAPVAVGAIAAKKKTLRSEASSGDSMDAAASPLDFAAADAKQFSSTVAAPELPSPSHMPLSGTPMAPPQNQSQAAIDQVWLLEVNERFSQGQLMQALTSNSISVPPELEQSAAVTPNKNVHPKDVDGIHVAAKPLQMKNALSQLSQSDAVTISAFHLPGEQREQEEADENLLADSASSAPLTIVPPQKAIAQKLRGNYFAQEASRPSSMVPKSFDKLEAKMGITPSGASEIAGDEITDQDAASDESGTGKSDIEVAAQPPSEMEQLFPDSALESDRLQNFLILIRNNAPSKK